MSGDYPMGVTQDMIDDLYPSQDDALIDEDEHAIPGLDDDWYQHVERNALHYATVAPGGDEDKHWSELLKHLTEERSR